MHASSDAAACITGDTLAPVSEVSIRDLRNHGGDIVERAAGGEPITITRSGTPVAQLTALPGRAVLAEHLLERWSRLPRIDADALRADIDATLDARL